MFLLIFVLCFAASVSAFTWTTFDFPEDAREPVPVAIDGDNTIKVLYMMEQIGLFEIFQMQREHI
jgi:hypothetical protein